MMNSVTRRMAVPAVLTLGLALTAGCSVEDGPKYVNSVSLEQLEEDYGTMEVAKIGIESYVAKLDSRKSAVRDMINVQGPVRQYINMMLEEEPRQMNGSDVDYYAEQRDPKCEIQTVTSSGDPKYNDGHHWLTSIDTEPKITGTELSSIALCANRVDRIHKVLKRSNGLLQIYSIADRTEVACSATVTEPATYYPLPKGKKGQTTYVELPNLGPRGKTEVQCQPFDWKRVSKQKTDF